MHDNVGVLPQKVTKIYYAKIFYLILIYEISWLICYDIITSCRWRLISGEDLESFAQDSVPMYKICVQKLLYLHLYDFKIKAVFNDRSFQEPEW